MTDVLHLRVTAKNEHTQFVVPSDAERRKQEKRWAREEWRLLKELGLTRPRLKLAPGAVFTAILPYVFSRKTIERVFTPALLDMHAEYFDALSANRKWLARAVRVRWALSVIETILLTWGVSLAKKIKAVWKLGS